MKFVKEPFNLFKQVMNMKASERGQLLCLDVRDQFVGVAVSNKENRVASPLKALTRDREQTMLNSMEDNFRAMIPDHNLAGFIVGTGDNDNGKAKLFIDELYELGTHHFRCILEGMKYTYCNSSSAKLPEYINKEKVEMLLKRLNVPKVTPVAIVDQFVAVCTLQGYLKHAWELHGDEKFEVSEEEEKEKESI